MSKNTKTTTTPSKWDHYEEWNKMLLLHWKIDPKQLKPLLPKGLELDLFHETAWISLVPYTVKKWRFRNLPVLPYVSNFHKITLRTYVIKDTIPGVYLFSVEISKFSAMLTSALLSGAKHKVSFIQRIRNRFSGENESNSFRLEIDYSVLKSIGGKSDLDLWLTERTIVYETLNGKLYRSQMQHKSMELRKIHLNHHYANYKINDFRWPMEQPDKMHYADKLKVFVSQKKLC